MNEYVLPKPSKSLIENKKYYTLQKTPDDNKREKEPINLFYNSSDYNCNPQSQKENANSIIRQ